MRYLINSFVLIFFLTGQAYLNYDDKTVKVYKENSSYSSDVICNIKKGRVYKKSSSYSSDVLFNFDGQLSIEEFVAVWYAYKYGWQGR